MLMTISIVKAEILSSSKTLASSKYSGAYIQAIPQVKCSNTGSFSWLSRYPLITTFMSLTESYK